MNTSKIWITLSTILAIALLISLQELKQSQDIKSIAKSYHQYIYTNSQDTWAKNKWAGITTLQNPNDAWIIQELIFETKPDFIIETGTHMGGSAVLWATILKQVNPNGKVITIDVEDQTHAAKKLPIFQEKVEFLLGSSTAPSIIEKISAQVRDKKVLVILDSLHKKEHVLRELELYSPLVQEGGYIVVQDSNINGHPVFSEYGPGPMEAIEKFLATHDDFESDLARERLVLTFHPKGYLKRTKAS